LATWQLLKNFVLRRLQNKTTQSSTSKSSLFDTLPALTYQFTNETISVCFPLRFPINEAKRASYSSLPPKNRKAEPFLPTQLGCQNASMRTHQPERDRLIYASVPVVLRCCCNFAAAVLARQGGRVLT
jgi:hypothetical protein